MLHHSPKRENVIYEISDLLPLSLRERGWGEGNSATSCTAAPHLLYRDVRMSRAQDAQERPNPLPAGEGINQSFPKNKKLIWT
jgi:hypothetical protein